ncbi:hypothetical protein [Amycolatopsis methanolica]|uniref:Uncharacterized protein n=1 Tax=Amycolatopsis methanolica 239 TaxID=1068978 RepID=A0A076N546_AMYME|nr:hypothetical protein [Amycolatopsis methanolica]AIJ26377.1 hypothetical protein AMETH_6285 [Amycolatopsis methanolica 239]AIJ26436.1 hypothetical protein AMETH_6344 [Amycolatopsis methanolica 239]
MTDIIELIDQAIGCHWCGGPLGDSPSPDFCCEVHQRLWAASRVQVTPEADVLRAALARAREQEAERRLEAAAVVLRGAAPVWRQLVEGVAQAFASLVPTVNAMAECLQHAGLARPAPPTDPKMRALHLRRHRNTGPDHRPRPPRTIHARGTR